MKKFNNSVYDNVENRIVFNELWLLLVKLKCTDVSTNPVYPVIYEGLMKDLDIEWIKK